jgi:hypothetical protein
MESTHRFAHALNKPVKAAMSLGENEHDRNSATRGSPHLSDSHPGEEDVRTRQAIFDNYPHFGAIPDVG